jgi:hypothetical protein
VFVKSWQDSTGMHTGTLKGGVCVVCWMSQN